MQSIFYVLVGILFLFLPTLPPYIVDLIAWWIAGKNWKPVPSYKNNCVLYWLASAMVTIIISLLYAIGLTIVTHIK